MGRAVCMAASGLLVAAVASGCGLSSGEGSSAEQAPSPVASATPSLDAEADLVLDFDDVPPSGLLEETSNLGTAGVVVQGLSFSGATLALEADSDGGQAVRFPSVSASPAVVTVASTGSSDVFSPGDASFRFAADVNLDPEAGGGDGSSPAGQDNGNNVVQRGLFGDDAQYKIQVDKGRASCRLQGDKGEVLVKADTTVPTETWTRLACTRRGDQVTLTQEVLEGPEAGTVETWQEEAAIGSIRMDADAGPLTVGGKVNAEGDPVRGNSDQFNGSIDNVVFDVAD